MLAGQSPERQIGSRFLGAPLASHVGYPDEPQAYLLPAVQNRNVLCFLIRNILFFVLICSVLSIYSVIKVLSYQHRPPPSAEHNGRMVKCVLKSSIHVVNYLHMSCCC